MPDFELGQTGRTPQRRRRRWPRVMLVILLIAILAPLASSYFFARHLERKMKLPPKEAAKLQRTVTAPKKDEAWDILLVGTDQRPGLAGSRADTIGLLRVDPKGKWGYLVSIPRDMRVAIPGRGLDKINHAWAFGQAPLLIRTTENFLDGLKINYFFQVDFAGFEQVVDALGGVRFSIDRGWNDGELGVDVRAGDHLRMGREALALVRARKEFGAGDFARIEHQQQFLLAVMRQSLTSYAQVPAVANILASYSRTNMDLGTMLALGRAFAGSQADIQTTTLPGTGGLINGVYYMTPDQRAKRAIIRAMVDHQPLPK